MRTSAVVLALSAAGCFTTTHISTVGPFVRTIGRDHEGMVIESCTIKRFEQTHHNAMNVVLKTSAETELQFTQDECLGSFVSLGADATSTQPRVISQ